MPQHLDRHLKAGRLGIVRYDRELDQIAVEACQRTLFRKRVSSVDSR